MPTVIRAVFVGDSHGIIMRSAAENAGITFEHSITSASAMFLGSTLTLQDDNHLRFAIAEFRLDTSRVAPETVAHRLHKASFIEQQFQSAFDTGLPVYSNIGMTARNFVLGIATAAKANGEDVSTISAKMLRIAAREHFEPYAAMYETMVQKAPRVIAVFGPTRFNEDTKALWMGYDDVAISMLKERGVEVLDLRQAMGDDHMLLRSKFYGDPDDGVHGGDAWGLAVVHAIQEHLEKSASEQSLTD